MGGKKTKPPAAFTPIEPGEIARAIADLGAALDPAETALLAAYLELLTKWNRAMNLVGPGDWRTILDTLAVDSLRIAPVLAEAIRSDPTMPENPLCLDLGAGAGLPGIPLRILWPQGRYLLVEPREKRALFMEKALAELRLAGTSVFQGRVEELPDEFVPADMVLSRAFMPWPDFLRLARGLVRPQGLALVLSNDPPPDKDELADKAPGWTLSSSLPYPAAGSVRHCWFLTRQ